MKIVKMKTIKNMLFAIVDDFSNKEEAKSLAKSLATITDDKITMFSISKKMNILLTAAYLIEKICCKNNIA